MIFWSVFECQPSLTKAVRYRLCHISIAPKWSNYSVVILFKIADCLSYQGDALPTEPYQRIKIFDWCKFSQVDITKVVLYLLSHNSMCQILSCFCQFLSAFRSTNQVLPRWCSTYWAITACAKYWVIFADFLVGFRAVAKSYQGGALPTEP